MVLRDAIMLAAAVVLTAVELRTATRSDNCHGEGARAIGFVMRRDRILTADLITAILGSLILMTATPVEVTGWRLWVIPIVFLGALANSLMAHNACLAINDVGVSIRWGLFPRRQIRFSDGCVVITERPKERRDEVWLCDMAMRRVVEIGDFVCAPTIVSELRSRGAIMKDVDLSVLPVRSSQASRVLRVAMCTTLIWLPVFYGPYSVHL